MRFGERKLFFNELGDVSFIKNTRARRLTIRVNAEGLIKVTVPYLISYRRASSFVETKKDWILKIKNDLKVNPRTKTIFKENSEFETLRHKILIEKYNCKNIKRIQTGENVRILVPVEHEIESQITQEKIRRLIIETWREEAKIVLSGKADVIAAKYGFKFEKLQVKNMRTRWGSCSHKNSINLNLHLIRLEDRLCDYVILHELVHTVHKNHGKEFWKMLISYNEDSRKLAKELKGTYIEMW